MKRIMAGAVVSDRMDKTVVVVIERFMKHPVYNKVIRRKSRFMVHDEKNQAHIGDIVKIEEYRPVSRKKRWRLLKVLREQEKK